MAGIIDNPQLKVPSVHIAGTNGKGTTAHAIAAIFISAGYRTGLYTSPHLIRMNERIRINNEEITDDELNMIIGMIDRQASRHQNLKLTYFDIMTLACFQYFSDVKADIAVVEAGLGGWLDSTNIIHPECSIITDISLDHSHILGRTIPDIAREKAGIIKPGVPVITSNTEGDSIAAIQKKSREAGAPLCSQNRDYFIDLAHDTQGRLSFNYHLQMGDIEEKINDIQTNFILPVQIKNCAMAVTASLMLGGRFGSLDETAIKNGLKNLRVPGRFEILSYDPVMVFDPGHNPAAVEATLGALLRHFPGKKIITVLSLMLDKDTQGILDIFNRHSIRIIYYPLPGKRTYDPPHKVIARYRITNAESAATLRTILSGVKDECIFFTGSFRLYETARGYAENL
jgi:dihydrofolate synthase/folylpolyglutamate synthase